MIFYLWSYSDIYIYRRKVVEKNNKDEDSSPKTLNDNDHQASSQKFRQVIGSFIISKTLECDFTKIIDNRWFFV